MKTWVWSVTTAVGLTASTFLVTKQSDNSDTQRQLYAQRVDMEVQKLWAENQALCKGLRVADEKTDWPKQRPYFEIVSQDRLPIYAESQTFMSQIIATYFGSNETVKGISFGVRRELIRETLGIADYISINQRHGETVSQPLGMLAINLRAVTKLIEDEKKDLAISWERSGEQMMMLRLSEIIADRIKNVSQTEENIEGLKAADQFAFDIARLSREMSRLNPAPSPRTPG